MNLSIEKSELARVIGVLDKFSGVQFLSCEGFFLVETSAEKKTFSAYNKGMQARVDFEGVCDTDGSFLLFAPKIKQMLAKLPEGTVVFEISESFVVVKTEKKKIRFSMKSMSPNSFVKFPVREGGFVEVDSFDFLESLRFVAKSAASDFVRGFLCSVFCEFYDNGAFRVVATDGKKLSYKDSAKDKLASGEKKTALLPIDFVNAVATLQPKASALISVDERSFFMKIGDEEFFTPFVKGDYPAYEKVIPAGLENEMVFDSTETRDVVARLLIYDSKLYLNLKRGKGLVYFTAKNSDLGEAYEELTVKGNGADCMLKFNALYLRDAFSTFKGDVSVKYANEKKPVVITDGGKGVHIVMPMVV